MPSSPQVSPSTGNAVRFPTAPELLKQVPAAAGKPPWVFHGEGEGSTTGASHGSPVEPPGPGWGDFTWVKRDPGQRWSLHGGFAASSGVCPRGEPGSWFPQQRENNGEVQPSKRQRGLPGML